MVGTEQRTVLLSSEFFGKDHPANSKQPAGKSALDTQFLLPAPGLPTIPLKGRGTWVFSYSFVVPMFSLGDDETQNSIFKIFRMH